MGIFKSSKKAAGHIVDVRVDKWVSWDYLSESADNFKVILLDSIIPKKATYSETFEEALERLELTEADIAKRQKEFTQLFYFFLVLSLVIISYGLYLAFTGSMITALIAFCLSIYSLAQSFRFHFWLFQLKNRKLGCTIKEWMNAAVTTKHEKNLAVKKNKSEKMSKTGHTKANE
ncbi:type IVB secretion system protein IcmV [Candidatus Berkiella aquae]|uniref:Type IVB secretion system protein IcmV n=1 Tax=Candidatus Berkiella aquae TaxID=295108 RepID=A0A0Q9YYD5_9GAMM|nr:type IVB secretion system protein IcmV [Candidatus Berkiella aquae]MCS5711141.1 type IVB secretion system protein IcmV [Candidatus Berkiella aquae]